MTWTVFLTARTEAKASKIIGWLTDQLGRELERSSLEPLVWKEPERTTYLFVLEFSLPLEASAWNDAVVEALVLGQRVGNQWKLSGDVRQELEGYTNFPRLSGVSSLQFRLRHGTA